MTEAEVRDRLRDLGRLHYEPFLFEPDLRWAFDWKGLAVTLDWHASIPDQDWPGGYLVAEIAGLYAERWYLGNIAAESVASMLDQVIDRKIAFEEKTVQDYLEAVNRPPVFETAADGSVVVRFS